jgi:hypothetical protein
MTKNQAILAEIKRKQALRDRPMPQDYAPYHLFPEFDQGITDYMEGRYSNPYTSPRDGVKAQAHDRGSEYAMRVIHHSGGR